MGHEHCSKVLEWMFDSDHHWKAALYGCTGCDETSLVPFPREEEQVVDHTQCGPECFRCKAQGLQLNAGDATRDIPDKIWRARLANYKKARADGIQPAGTTPGAVEQAYKASETLGTAYNAEKHPSARVINNNVKEILKETGAL